MRPLWGRLTFVLMVLLIYDLSEVNISLLNRKLLTHNVCDIPKFQRVRRQRKFTIAIDLTMVTRILLNLEAINSQGMQHA